MASTRRLMSSLEEEVASQNPVSGRYQGNQDGLRLDMNVDVDKLRPHSKVLKVISGFLYQTSPSGLWEGPSKAAYFRSISLAVSKKSPTEVEITAETMTVLSEGEYFPGKVIVRLSLPQRAWHAQVEVTIDNKKRTFTDVNRTSLFFRNVKLDIDHSGRLVFPVVEHAHLMRHTSDRKLDAFVAFEDAGIKLHYNKEESQQLKDPTPATPWTKSDMYEAMMHYFDETEDSDHNIWCMMGTKPPDRRYMGYTFDHKGRRGFGLFIGHSAFDGYDSSNPKVRAEASRRLLHYLMHECGHALGLLHPFEIGEPDSLSWMNYAWKYDERHCPGSFYESFAYSFSDTELRALRHFPDKEYRAICTPKALAICVDYGTVTNFPDETLADDDSDNDEERAQDATAAKKPMRKIALDLKLKNRKLSVIGGLAKSSPPMPSPRGVTVPFPPMQALYPILLPVLGTKNTPTESGKKGDALRFEAQITNVGKLPVLIERGLSIELGNLSLNITEPDGSTQTLKSPVSPILSGHTRPHVLYTEEVNEGQGSYSELVTVGSASRGFAFDTPGEYSIRAMYKAGRYAVTSDTYSVKVIAPEKNEEDEEAKSQAVMAISLEGSNYERFAKVAKYWQDLAKAGVEAKREKIGALLSLSKSLVNASSRQPDYSGKKAARAKQRPANLGEVPAAKTPHVILKDTDDLLHFMQNEGKKSDNLDYIELVKMRGNMYKQLDKFDEAEAEFNRMLADLLLRGVEQDSLKKLVRQWRKIKQPKPIEEKYTSENLQKKFVKILKWCPSVQANGEPEISGVGLGMPFGNFMEEDIRKGLKVVELLFNKYYETKDLVAVLSYADKLQKGREVNFLVLHWALETFVVHCLHAKKAGLKYPEPADMDKSMASLAALVSTARTGTPREEWMNYWRCDADYNYHHRHWHIVYIVGRFVNGVSRSSPIFTNAPPHLERQGELFGYMHCQMVARYDAERESWGLAPVQQWEYDEVAPGFNAGLEFHNDDQYRSYAPRPSIGWPDRAIRDFRGWEAAYQNALSSGVVFENVEMTPNWSGHVLESSSRLYADIFGSIHNTGHGIFGSTGLPRNMTSYMNDTSNAVRDLIFYRWHKRIDNLWQANNVYYRSEISNDAPPVTLEVVVDTDPALPTGFDGWNGDWTGSAPGNVTTIQTKLGPPMKRFEWDNKISHEPFYYHLRVKRNPGTNTSDQLRLTVRLFIVPKRRENDRTRFIEMDKFVIRLDAGVDHAVFTRADRHSSVIKRVPDDMTNDFEERFVVTNPGFCECGWPYHMLLPRGTGAGEEYVLYAIATDNTIDSIGIRTTCGSMSYCGAQGQAYPDARNMGYPFSSPITVGGESTSIPSAFDRITNGTKTTFFIRNNISEPPPIPAVDVWRPYVQLGLNDGTAASNAPVTDYTQSGWRGRFRVLIDRRSVRPNRGDRIMLRFQGRGVGGGEYRMSDVSIATRSGNTMVATGGMEVLYKGEASFTVAEEGIITDPIPFRFRPIGTDYFLTFTLQSPGVFLRTSLSSQTTMTSRIENALTPGADGADWSRLPITNNSRNIYCIAAIMAES